MLVKPSKTLININKPLQQAIVAGKVSLDLIDEKSEENQVKIELLLNKLKDICFSKM